MPERWDKLIMTEKIFIPRAHMSSELRSSIILLFFFLHKKSFRCFQRPNIALTKIIYGFHFGSIWSMLLWSSMMWSHYSLPDILILKNIKTINIPGRKIQESISSIEQRKEFIKIKLNRNQKAYTTHKIGIFRLIFFPTK